MSKCQEGFSLSRPRSGVELLCCFLYHTAGSDTIFIQIYMDAPPGIPGVSKKFTSKTVLALRLPPKGTNFKKSSKLKKNVENPVFLEYFEYSSILGQY